MNVFAVCVLSFSLQYKKKKKKNESCKNFSPDIEKNRPNNHYYYCFSIITIIYHYYYIYNKHQCLCKPYYSFIICSNF